MSHLHLPVAFIIVLAVSIQGCAPVGGRAKPGTRFYVYKREQGIEVLGLEWQKSGAQAAFVTNNPADEEFWQFDVRINDGVIYNVIGDRGKCEAVRTGSSRTASLSEPCQGPFYFKRGK